MQPIWIEKAVFYHIYPLGLVGAPEKNDFWREPENRIMIIKDWIPYLKELGINAIYFGPVFESTSHGYDTADYYSVDRRLGKNDVLKQLIKDLHNNGIRVVLDGVFNHTGRDFWAFRDLISKGGFSQFSDWFKGFSFNGRSSFNDPFVYEGWAGHYNLIKINPFNPDVVNHIFGAVEMWIDEFDIDGLRLDVADCLEPQFMKQLSRFCRYKKNDFWLMGEVVHGDYNHWVNDEMLDSVTNYECYKGLYSSHNDNNYFEIAYSLKRQFGENGIYKNLRLYNFIDNHDVNRIASTLYETGYIYTINILLFTIPGIPSLYYGSEFGIQGEKKNNSDSELRPYINLSDTLSRNNGCDLKEAITKLIKIRKENAALQAGDYNQIFVKHQQFAFSRKKDDDLIVVVVNSSEKEEIINLKLDEYSNSLFTDLLCGEQINCFNGEIAGLKLYPYWGRILKKNKY